MQGACQGDGWGSMNRSLPGLPIRSGLVVIGPDMVGNFTSAFGAAQVIAAVVAEALLQNESKRTCRELSELRTGY